MLIAKNLTKSYGQLQVLKGIDLSIPQGEIVSIIGSSGAGKSTLLHILGTLDQADQGSLEINGNLLSSMKEKELARFRNLHIGFVFQFHNLLPEFSAQENILIPAMIAGSDMQKASKKAEELMQMLGIYERREHKPSQLSGGEQQRTAVARALINNPTLVFADEPSGNLDSKNAEELHQLFLRLNKELGQTFVIVTHNKELAGLSHRVVEMKDGKILV